MNKANSPLRVGFDLDGVILYNPARIIRPIIHVYKRYILKKKSTKFRIPQSKWEMWVLTMLHKSSIFIAPGYDDIQRLVKEGKIEAYLITARFNFLKKDFEQWLKKMNAHDIFTAIHLNEKNEQPHMYKEQLVKKYGLDVFIDDNWDIINHLHNGLKNKSHKAKPIWVYNLFDRHIQYPYKHSGLFQVMQHLETTLKKRK